MTAATTPDRRRWCGPCRGTTRTTARQSRGERACLLRARARTRRRPREASGRCPRSTVNYNEGNACASVRHGPGDCRLDWRTGRPRRDRGAGNLRRRLPPPGAGRRACCRGRSSAKFSGASTSSATPAAALILVTPRGARRARSPPTPLLGSVRLAALMLAASLYSGIVISGRIASRAARDRCLHRTLEPARGRSAPPRVRPPARPIDPHPTGAAHRRR